MYFYESHLGGIFYSEEALDFDMLYCEQCGDSDNLIGYADNKEEAINLLINDDDSVNYSDYVMEVIEEAFA